MSSLSGRVRSAITPECSSLSRSIKYVSLISMIIVLVALVILVSGIIYNYMKKVPNGADAAAVEDKKKKVVGSVTITAAVVVALSLITSIWEYAVVSKTANQCLAPIN